jgi:DivIVA domain-containing protein
MTCAAYSHSQARASALAWCLMKREDIERHDFPVGRRGYDQAAVDAHLRRVADELEGLRAPATPLSAGTSEHVRVILEAAEASAAEMRADAGRHVAKVQQATGGMLNRLDELERELGTLLEALRRGGERLNEGLARLSEDLAEPAAADEDFAGAQPAAVDEVAPAPTVDGDEAGARLIALNMALSGTPREETAAYLAEHFQLADADALLDDVYERAGQ